jgi:hypothetical protein
MIVEELLFQAHTRWPHESDNKFDPDNNLNVDFDPIERYAFNFRKL